MLFKFLCFFSWNACSLILKIAETSLSPHLSLEEHIIIQNTLLVHSVSCNRKSIIYSCQESQNAHNHVSTTSNLVEFTNAQSLCTWQPKKNRVVHSRLCTLYSFSSEEDDNLKGLESFTMKNSDQESTLRHIFDHKSAFIIRLNIINLSECSPPACQDCQTVLLMV